MKFKIVRKFIDKFFIEFKDWDESLYTNICNELNYNIKTIKDIIENQDKIIGYQITNSDNRRIPVYYIWYLDEFSCRMQGWKQYEWCKYHDREYDDCALTTDLAKIKCIECKGEKEKYYGKVVEEFEI